MCCQNITANEIPCNVSNKLSFKDSIVFLPNSIRKEIILLAKQYNIIKIDQCGDGYSFNKHGEEYELDITYFNGKRIYIRNQEYDIKIYYTNTETGQEFFKVFLSYEN